MLAHIILSLALAFISNAQGAIDNGAGSAVPSEAPGLEKRRIIGWTTRWVTYYPTESHDGDCHHHHRPGNTETIFVVPSTITEVKSKTVYTYQTIPVPVPVPPCPCGIPDCHRNGCRRGGSHDCGSSQANPCNSCHGGGGGNNVISTSTLPHTTPAPASSVIILSTKTNSVTIYTQSSPPSNGSDAVAKVDVSMLLLSIVAAAAVLMA